MHSAQGTKKSRKMMIHKVEKSKFLKKYASVQHFINLYDLPTDDFCSYNCPTRINPDF